MNSGPTAERVYDAIKRRILNRGFRAGERLDAAELAGQVSSSITPVRDALHVLLGEQLVESTTSGGFHAPHADEPGLVDLYRWNYDVLDASIRAWSPEGGSATLEGALSTGEEASIAALAGAIARRSVNSEHVRAIASLNDRLHAVRLQCEPAIVAPPADELAELGRAFTAGDARTLRRLLGAYHRRRLRKASAIVRALYRA